jgi:hypothetical protein
MRSARIARHLGASIASRRSAITDIIGRPDITFLIMSPDYTFLIMVSTGHGAGPTSDALGVGNGHGRSAKRAGGICILAIEQRLHCFSCAQVRSF